MLFLTYWFVLFACLAYPAYWLVRVPQFQRLILLAFSCVFHTYFAGPAGVLPILALGVMTYLIGLTRRRSLCVLGGVVCVVALVFYKYTKFLCLSLIGAVWSEAGAAALASVEPWMPIAAPLAISFFVFEFVHYLFEVGRGHEPVRDPIDFALFSFFWPSIVAGPVKRYEQFLDAVRQGLRAVSSSDVAAGLVLVALGLVKKFSADILTGYITYWEPHFEVLPLYQRWMIFVGLGFRILWDFSGYSNMAIGFALMFGVRLPCNFRWPYLAANLAEFWRRWHISLSSWIRDYVYIPLGGSRAGLLRRAFNGLFAFALCGLWHGAAFNFLVWGVYHGAGLAVVSNYKAALGGVGARIAEWFHYNRAVGWLTTMLYVNVGWLFFFYPLPRACQMLTGLVGR